MLLVGTANGGFDSFCGRVWAPLLDGTDRGTGASQRKGAREPHIDLVQGVIAIQTALVEPLPSYEGHFCYHIWRFGFTSLTFGS